MSGRLTLLLLPGTLCDERVWASQIDALSLFGRVVVTGYDTADTIGDMAERALASVGKDTRIVPIGLSMGGMVALEIWRIARSRVAALALLATNPLPDTPERRASRDNLIEGAAERGMPYVARQLARAYCRSDAETPAALIADVVCMATSIGIDGFRTQSAALATRRDYRRLLTSIDVPVLVMAGQHDRICGVQAQQQMAAAIPKATCEIVPDAAHLIPLEVPSATNRLLTRWLTTIFSSHTAQVSTLPDRS